MGGMSRNNIMDDKSIATSTSTSTTGPESSTRLVLCSFPDGKLVDVNHDDKQNGLKDDGKIESDGQSEAVGAEEEDQEKGHAFFFFGTLMVPAILTRVLGHGGEKLSVRDAVLENHVRLAVTGADYPAVVPVQDLPPNMAAKLSPTDKVVRGTYVTGLSDADVEALDVFEGDEYTRQRIPVTTLSEAHTIQQLRDGDSGDSNGQPQPIAVPTSRMPVEQVLAHQHQSKDKRMAEVYVWSAGIDKLDEQVWDFRSFLAHKSARWTGIKPMSGQDNEERCDEYDEVDRHRALGGRTFPDQHAATASEPPRFGKALLKYWQFDPNYINLNHGSYGSPPRPVIAAMRELSARCESNPDLFMRRSYQPLLRDVRHRLATLVGAQDDEVVIAANASTAMNAIVWNLDWKAGDLIVAYSITYGAVQQTMKHICDKYPGVKYVEVPVRFPEMSHADVVRATEQALDDHGGKDSSSSRKVVVIDSIASVPAVRMPWRAIVQLCASRPNTLSIVDAAHSLGHEPVDLSISPRPDFWLSNAHKWLFAHRGVAALFVRKDRQKQLMRTSLPTGHGYVSERYPDGREWTWVDQWEWTGTQDWAPALSIPAAIEFRQFLGGEEAIQSYCSSLALKGGHLAASILGTNILENSSGELKCGLAMVDVRLPIDAAHVKAPGLLGWLMDAQFARGSFAAPYIYNGSWWARMSAQVWNETSDFERCAKTLEVLCRQVNDGSWRTNDVAAV